MTLIGALEPLDGFLYSCGLRIKGLLLTSKVVRALCNGQAHPLVILGDYLSESCSFSIGTVCPGIADGDGLLPAPRFRPWGSESYSRRADLDHPALLDKVVVVASLHEPSWNAVSTRIVGYPGLEKKFLRCSLRGG
jgi:hypothetical protein